MATLLGIVGSPTIPSKTRTAVEHALAAVDDEVTTDLLHLAEHDLERADGRTLDEYGGDTATAIERVVESDMYLIGTPVYRGTYAGGLKNLLDLVPRGGWQAAAAPLANSAVGLMATAATANHYLAIDQELRPLLAFFGAHVVGSSVFLTDDQFEDAELVDAEARNRLAGLGRATLALGRAIEHRSALSELDPQV